MCNGNNKLPLLVALKPRRISMYLETPFLAMFWYFIMCAIVIKPGLLLPELLYGLELLYDF